MQAEVRIAADQVARALKARRAGELVTTWEGLESPRQKWCSGLGPPDHANNSAGRVSVKVEPSLGAPVRRHIVQRHGRGRGALERPDHVHCRRRIPPGVGHLDLGQIAGRRRRDRNDSRAKDRRGGRLQRFPQNDSDDGERHQTAEARHRPLQCRTVLDGSRGLLTWDHDYTSKRAAAAPMAAGKPRTMTFCTTPGSQCPSVRPKTNRTNRLTASAIA